MVSMHTSGRGSQGQPGTRVKHPTSTSTSASTYVGHVGGDEGEGDEDAPDEGLGQAPEEVHALGQLGLPVLLEQRRALLWICFEAGVGAGDLYM